AWRGRARRARHPQYSRANLEQRTANRELVVRIANYDSIASKYDRRYDLYEYAGCKQTLATFLGSATSVLEVGCGTGHWLNIVAERSAPAFAEGFGASTVARSASEGGTASAERPIVAGVEPSSEMLARARDAAPSAVLIRATAEALPFGDATFD